MAKNTRPRKLDTDITRDSSQTIDALKEIEALKQPNGTKINWIRFLTVLNLLAMLIAIVALYFKFVAGGA